MRMSDNLVLFPEIVIHKNQYLIYLAEMKALLSITIMPTNKIFRSKDIVKATIQDIGSLLSSFGFCPKKRIFCLICKFP